MNTLTDEPTTTSEPLYGTYRPNRKFLWFPTYINGSIQWLKRVYVTEVYTPRYSGVSSILPWYFVKKWYNFYFME